MNFNKNNNLDLTQKLNFLTSFTFYGIVLITIFILIKFIVPFFSPFIIGFLIAFVLKPITCLISSKTSLSRKICGAIVVILTYIIIVIFLWIISSKIVIIIQNIANNNQHFFSLYFMPVIKNLDNIVNNFLNKNFPTINFKTDDIFESMIGSLDQTIAETSKALISWIAKFSSTIPSFLIGLTFAITSSIYISSDYVKITKTFNQLVPSKFQKIIETTKNCAIKIVLKYFKAYLLLTLINFSLLTLSFFILKIDNPIGLAALTSICDIIPIFGSIVIFLPWTIYLITIKQFSLAIKICLIFLTINILHGFLEPKILGNQIGLHPVLTLMSVYVGMKLFGFIGIFLLPISLQICFSIYKSEQTLYLN